MVERTPVLDAGTRCLGYVVAGHARQDQGQDPAEKRPAEREIQQHDRAGVLPSVDISY